ncbi:MAG: hypothetical protein Q8M29_12915 [Bacteroidota bacterium]|nr:hypothetical protein [Bacteroidota bacterium]
MNSKHIEKWEMIGLIISILIVAASIVLEFIKFKPALDHPTTVSIITGLASGFIATITVLFFERKHNQSKLDNHFVKFVGKYERIDIGQDNTKEEKLTNLKNQNIGLLIELSYKEDHEFTFVANYWKDRSAQTIGFIEFNSKDKNTAYGHYRYISGENLKDNYGKLELSWDNNKNEFIVFYNHKYPRTLLHNPDNNRGWEVWKKLSV